MGRIAAAREVTGAVQFLASEGAGFVTGEIITVDGGGACWTGSAYPRIEGAHRARAGERCVWADAVEKLGPSPRFWLP